jgi:hypothetical protein
LPEDFSSIIYKNIKKEDILEQLFYAEKIAMMNTLL